MKKYLVTISLLLTCCGTDDSSDPATDINKQSNKSTNALYLENFEDLPDCDDNNENQLVYVKSDGLFYNCIAHIWGKVEIKGNAGKNGTDGEDGIDGKNQPENVWENPDNGELWTIGGSTKINFVNCGENFRLPTKDEALDALSLGLYQHASTVSGNTTMFTGDTFYHDGTAQTVRWKIRNLNGSYTSTFSADDSTSYGVYCVEK